MNCESCYKLQASANATTIKLPLAIGAAIDLVAYITDKFDHIYTQDVTSDDNGNVFIDISEMPEGFFNKYFGKVKIEFKRLDADCDLFEFTDPCGTDEFTCIAIDPSNTIYTTASYLPPERTDQETELFVAGETIPPNRVVVEYNALLYLFDPTNSAHFGLVKGISKTSGIITDQITVVTEGTMAGFTGLTQNANYFSDDNGVLTTTPSGSNVMIQHIGHSVDATRFYVDLGEAERIA